MTAELAPTAIAPGGSQLTDPGRLPPQDLDAEESVLGGILLDNEALDKIPFLRAEDFYREKHRRVFAAMRELSEKSEPVDLVTLGAELKGRDELEAVGGQTFLAYLAGRVPTSANIKYYGEIVQEKSLLRSMISVSTHIAASGYEAGTSVGELLDRAEAAILDIGEYRLKDALRPIKDAMRETFKHIERIHDSGAEITGVPTGFTDLDRLLGGFQDTDLIILAARPSMGKTALALNMASNVALRYKMPVAIFSLEMSREQLVMRLLFSKAEVNWTLLRQRLLPDEKMKDLIDAAAALSESPLYIDDTPVLTPLELKAKVRRIKRQHKEEKGLIVVDYLQLMQGQGTRSQENRVQEVSEISRSLKALAKEVGWPVLALSQLNRSLEHRTDKTPVLADLRESGAIEQDADVVSFIHRESYYNKNDPSIEGLADLIIAKNRNGPTDKIPLTFRRQFTRFEDYASRDVPVEVADEGGVG